MKCCSWVPSSQHGRYTLQSQHHRSPEHRCGRQSYSPPHRCQSGRGLHTWAPATQGHSVDSAQCLADRPPQAGSGGTAVHSSRQKCQVGRAGGTGFRSSPARRTHSCLCLQSMAPCACSDRSCRGSEARSCRRGRAARSGHRGSPAGRRTGRRRRCSDRARTRTAAGTRGPTSPGGRRSGRSPVCTGSHGRRSGSCSGGPTSPAHSGRSRRLDRSAPPPGCTGTGGGKWRTTSRARSGTRPSRGRNARAGCRRKRTHNGRPSGPLGSGTRPWPARTGRVGGRHRSHGSRDPSTGRGSGSCTGPRRIQVCIDRGLVSHRLHLPGRHLALHRWLKNIPPRWEGWWHGQTRGPLCPSHWFPAPCPLKSHSIRAGPRGMSGWAPALGLRRGNRSQEEGKEQSLGYVLISSWVGICSGYSRIVHS